ncbi:MAG: hypothetical protein DRQ44_03215 [Gammaproteobacteria bacterium]|nr:MAG: hypothetical protein DRQ44_03215 [Gammaproteobacteria bacterium]
MKNRRFIFIAFVVAVTFWFLESLIHYTIFNEPQFEFIPGDMNELWMRLVIVLLILIYGIYVDFSIDKVVHKQLEVARMYSSISHSSYHILNNLINQMQLFELEAKRCSDFDKDIIVFYDKAIKEASDLADTLAKISDIPDSN